MTEKPSASAGKTRIDALKLRAEQLGLVPYASLYGDKRRTATWEKLLENAPELEPLHPRPQFSQFKSSDYRLPHRRHYAIVLSVAAVISFCLLQPLLSKTLPIQIDFKIQVTGQK